MDLKQEIDALLNAEVSPIAMVQSEVMRLPFPEPFAYRTSLVINSIELGALSYEQYSVTAERTKRAIVLAGRALTYARRIMEQYEDEGKEYEWLSVKCPDTILTKTNLPETLSNTFLGKEELLSKLALEFSPQLFFNASPDALEGLAAAKSLGVRVILNGFGDEYCPITKLGDYPIDMAVLHPRFMDRLRDEREAPAAKAVIAYIQALDIKMIAPSLRDDEQVALAEKIACTAYTSAEVSENLLWEIGKWAK